MRVYYEDKERIEAIKLNNLKNRCDDINIFDKVLLNTLRNEGYEVEESNDNTFIITNASNTRFKVEILMHNDYREIFVYDELEKNKCIEHKNIRGISEAYDFIQISLL